MADVKTVRAYAKGVDLAPRKVSVVASLVRNRTVADALVILEHVPRRSALPIAKAIKSAAAKSRGALFVCSLPRLVVPGCGEDIAHQHGPGHGPHAAGHRSDVGCLGFYRGEVYIAAEVSLFIEVYTHI